MPMLSTAFAERKDKILHQLNVPDDEYSDLSPKGSVDERIRILIKEINQFEGLVTTSSCAGRVSVYVDGPSKILKTTDVSHQDLDSRSTPTGGKGGGRWLFVSHDPLHIPAARDASEDYFQTMFRLKSCTDNSIKYDNGKSLIHFKFEPMILHVLTASLKDAQNVIFAAVSAGFRESGAINLSANTNGTISPMVAVRSTGLALDSLVGHQGDFLEGVATVDENYLRTMAIVANDRFKVNSDRIERFRAGLLRIYQVASEAPNTLRSVKSDWEDAEERKSRKRVEGLQRKALLEAERASATHKENLPEEIPDQSALLLSSYQ